ncbi:type VI secretion system contractile sheath small subunit [Erwinia sp.]|uniref:type VI secretion system contractile sheath small subunit n=1 Tax=Erwinia citreus TaxID=558 RepID=UPI003C744425
MVDSFQSEISTLRINMKVDLHNGGAKKNVEPPLKLLVVGDFSNGKAEGSLSERERININKNNFNSVFSDMNPEVSLTVKNTLSDEGTEESVQLSFQSMKDFEPEKIARQIPQLRAMLSMRNLLRDLKSTLLDNVTFRKELELILKDSRFSEPLRKALNVLPPAER